MKTTDSVDTGTFLAKSSTMTFIDILVAVVATPSLKGTSASVINNNIYRHSKCASDFCVPILQYVFPFTTHFFGLPGQWSEQLDP